MLHIYTQVGNIFQYLMLLPMWHVFIKSDLLKPHSVRSPRQWSSIPQSTRDLAITSPRSVLACHTVQKWEPFFLALASEITKQVVEKKHEPLLISDVSNQPSQRQHFDRFDVSNLPSQMVQAISLLLQCWHEADGLGQVL